MAQPKPSPQDYAVPPPALSSRGPYNPVAVLPSKLAKRILELDFVEMSEISLDDPPSQAPGQPPLPARPPVQDISVWMEKYSIMAALLASRFLEKAPELFAYQASIIRAEQNFDDRRCVTYGRCFRREALAQKSLDWSIPNARLYNEAFTGRAKAVPRCTFCLQEDHVAQHCPHYPNCPWPGWFQEPMPLQPNLSHRPLQLAPLNLWNAAAATTRENVGRQQQHADTHIAAQSVGAHILACTAPAEGRGVIHAHDRQSTRPDRQDPPRLHRTPALGTEGSLLRNRNTCWCCS